MAKKLVERFFDPPKKASYFLFGPRGTGKSRFLKAHYPNATFVDLLDDRTYLGLSNDPSRIEKIIAGLNDSDHCVIDEVQKSPNLLSKIHQIMEDDNFPKVQFILTGSSSRKLKRQGTDLLSGRAIMHSMHPFMAAEIRAHFKLESALQNGLLPLVYNSENPEATLSSYISSYLREEVKQEGLVKNLESFSRFLEIMSFSHAEVLNLSSVARESAVKRSTVDGYLEVLEDLLLGYRIPPFKKRNRKNTIDSDKFYFFDCGIFRSLRAIGPLDTENNFIGQALEGLVLQNLRAWTSYRQKGESIYFWRTMAQNEVDFIIYGPKTFLAIEVKNTRAIKSEHLSGLRSFKEDYPTARCLLLYRGKKKETHHSISCMSVEDFLLNMEL